MEVDFPNVPLDPSVLESIQETLEVNEFALPEFTTSQYPASINFDLNKVRLGILFDCELLQLQNLANEYVLLSPSCLIVTESKKRKQSEQQTSFTLCMELRTPNGVPLKP